MLVTRAAVADDLPFVFNSFTLEYARSIFAEGMSRVAVRQLIVNYVLDYRWKVRILIDDETPDEIIGYVIFKDETHVAWLYVKGIYRRKGLASRLLHDICVAKGPIKATFIPSPDFSRKARSKGWNLLHRPWQT